MVGSPESMKSTPIRVLILEDRSSDTELILHELRRAGFDPDWVRVETEQEYLTYLDSAPDIILADYHLSQFDAPRALELLQERELDIPFIVVTGVLGDEVAVELMKRGVTDYLLKDWLGRLGQGVLRALEQKKLREQRLRDEEQIKGHHRRQAVLRDINLAVTSSLDHRAVLNILMEKIDVLLPYSGVMIWLLNKESGVLEQVASRNLRGEDWKEGRWETTPPFLSMVLQAKAPVVVRNIQTDPRAWDPDFFRKQGLVSYVGIPMKAKGEILGVLSFGTKWEHQFNDEEIEFLVTLAGEASIAIHNSRLYEQTKNQAEALQRSNMVKDQFLSVMSHELRTPLSVIMGHAGMATEGILGNVTQRQKESLDKIMRSAEELLTMVDGIMEVTKLEARVTKVERIEFGLEEFLGDLETAYNFPLDKEFTLTWDVPSNLPVIRTDRGKLKQILQNLINNAITFTDKGSVTISAQYLPGTASMEFKVADTGIGISKEALPLIFEKFRQLDSSNSRSHVGAGLGLYIVKQFSELLGGTVRVESEPGRGSTFVVTIPTKHNGSQNKGLEERNDPNKNFQSRVL